MLHQARSLVISERFIQLEQRTITYTLRRNRRAKRVTLRVDQSGLTMIVPWSFPQDQLEPFIYQKRDWVIAMLDRFGRHAAPLGETTWSPASGVTLLGRQRGIRFDDSHQGITLSEDTIILPGRLAKDDQQARLVLESWLKEFARQYLIERLAQRSSIMGVSPRRITLRNQKTRWGSCSSQGAISLNWRLVMAPPTIIDYILIHELAHLIEMNHSDRFWQIVARYDPHYREHRLWLRENGARLCLFP